jgi:competence ComEA-like helix-hairpin-helix protein
VVSRATVTEFPQTKPDPPPAQAAPSDPHAPAQDDELSRLGEELVNKVCDSSCHGLERLDEMRRTPRDWNDVVTTMATKGATATDAQFGTIKKYLVRYYGIIAVNTATADDLSAVLGLTAKDAAAIVQYRDAHGKFADVEALMKVPGIDTAKIEEQPDALRFN